MKYHTHILIVGAGPAGLTLACLLAKLNIPFLIIDKKPAISTHIKACMLSSRSLEIFSDLGITDKVMALGQQTDSFDIYKGAEKIVSIDYSVVKTRFPFNCHIGQPLIEKVLYDNLTDQKINVLWQHELTHLIQSENNVVATIANGSTITIHADFVVGADGASSSVRKLCGVVFEGDTYHSHFLLGSLTLDWDFPSNAARLFFGDFGFLSVYPLHNHMMQIGGNIPEPTPGDEPNLKTLEDFFHARCVFPGKLRDLKNSAYYRTHCRYVKERVINRVILIGDAAHIISPLTGLGMNAGIQDAENLASQFALIHKNNADKKILENYQVERYAASKKLSSFSNVLETVYIAKEDESKRLREYMLSNLMSSEAIREKEAKRLMQIG